jgi:NAD+ kinase
MKIHFTSSAKPAAQHTVQQFIDRYGQNDLADATYVVAIGGDGTALNALRFGDGEAGYGRVCDAVTWFGGCARQWA